MKMCHPKKKVNGFEFECPLKNSCARAQVEHTTENIFKEAPYDFEKEYCNHFFWVGYKTEKA